MVGKKNKFISCPGVCGRKAWEISTAEILVMGKFIKGLSQIKMMVGMVMEQQYDLSSVWNHVASTPEVRKQLKGERPD